MARSFNNCRKAFLHKVDPGIVFEDSQRTGGGCLQGGETCEGGCGGGGGAGDAGGGAGRKGRQTGGQRPQLSAHVQVGDQVAAQRLHVAAFLQFHHHL